MCYSRKKFYQNQRILHRTTTTLSKHHHRYFLAQFSLANHRQKFLFHRSILPQVYIEFIARKNAFVQ